MSRNEQVLHSSAAINVAVQWLVTTPTRQRPAPLVPPAMPEMFNLTSIEACAAIRQRHLTTARST